MKRYFSTDQEKHPHLVTIRFYEELNDFIPVQYHKQDLYVPYTNKRSVKDLIESCGVPHVEVDLILVNGKAVDFNYQVKCNDRISVYPVFERLNISNVTRLRPQPLRNSTFVADVHLTKLAKNLRLLGFDVDYKKHRDDPELASISEKEKRVLLTRDRGLLMRKKVSRGIIIRNRNALLQTIEVIERLDLWDSCRPFTRCTLCNGIVHSFAVDTKTFKAIEPCIPPGVLSWCTTYYQCDHCDKIYWKGSHYDKMEQKVKKILDSKK